MDNHSFVDDSDCDLFLGIFEGNKKTVYVPLRYNHWRLLAEERLAAANRYLERARRAEEFVNAVFDPQLGQDDNQWSIAPYAERLDRVAWELGNVQNAANMVSRHAQLLDHYVSIKIKGVTGVDYKIYVDGQDITLKLEERANGVGDDKTSTRDWRLSAIWKL